MRNGKSIQVTTTDDGSTGDKKFSQMWKRHFEQLNISVPAGYAKAQFYQRLQGLALFSYFFRTSVLPDNAGRSMLTVSRSQKMRKAVGLDGVAVEALVHGGHRLLVNLSLLFNLGLIVWYKYLH